MNLNISNIDNDLYLHDSYFNNVYNNNIIHISSISQNTNDTNNLVNQYIDCCIGTNGSHYDISLTIYEILKNKYRYSGNKLWDYYDNTENTWKNDEKNQRLKYDIRNVVSNNFVIRSVYWENKSTENNININISNDHKLRSARLLQCSFKLKDDKFILTIIKEARQLFIKNDK